LFTRDALGPELYPLDPNIHFGEIIMNTAACEVIELAEQGKMKVSYLDLDKWIGEQ
jgi:hypothetical protein